MQGSGQGAAQRSRVVAPRPAQVSYPGALAVLQGAEPGAVAQRKLTTFNSPRIRRASKNPAFWHTGVSPGPAKE